MITPDILINLLLILSVAWILGIVFSNFGLPAMLGELLGGIILGPPLLGIVIASPTIEILAELGIFFVMFHSGMEMDPKELLEHIWPSLGVALFGFVLPYASGFILAKAFDATLYQALVIGMGVSITAIAVQVVILHSMRINKSEVGHVIIGAAIVDNILSLIALATVLNLAKTGSVDIASVSIILGKVILFFGVTILLGEFIMPRFTKHLTDKGGKAFTFAMVAALVMSYLAELAGLHHVIGAFLAGQFVRREIMDDKVYEVINDRLYGISYGFLVPIFFASLSFHLHISLNPSFFLFAFALILTGILGKLVGCGLGAALFKYNFWESAIIGFGMNGRGAAELVVATVVIEMSDKLLAQDIISQPLLTPDQFSGLVLMAFVTTFIAPISLKWSVKKACLSSERAAFCQLWDDSKGLNT
ncbi:cation:proton antiporter [Thermodesulfobacteriota bacterium]